MEHSLERNNWLSQVDTDFLRSSQLRQRLDDKKRTILDPRQRRIGIDVDAIQQQIEEKKAREAREKARDAAFDHMALNQQDLLMQNHEREMQLRRRMDKERDRFRMSQQTPQQSREYDIWRPDLLKISRPARVGDHDPTLGPASGQVFGGEDLMISERLKMQAQQRTEWYNEQVRERDAIKRREEMQRLTNELTELETQKQLAELDRLTEYAKAQVRQEIANDNLNMHNQRIQREKMQRELEQQQNDAELRTNARSRMIMETMGTRRDSPQDYRGMTVEEQKKIIDEQAEQMRQNEVKRQEERDRERQWYEYQEYLKAEGDKNEAEWLRRKQREQEALYRTHLQQEDEFKRRERYLNKEVYGKNIPDNYYYDSWGNDVR